MATSTLTITDNRTGRSYEVPVASGTIRAIDLRQIKVELIEDSEQKIARPRQIYTGHGERDYVPAARRRGELVGAG